MTWDPGYLTELLSEATRDSLRRRADAEGFYRRIMPPLPVVDDELERVVPTDLPITIVDAEPWSPAAFVNPYDTLGLQMTLNSFAWQGYFDKLRDNVRPTLADFRDLAAGRYRDFCRDVL